MAEILRFLHADRVEVGMLIGDMIHALLGDLFGSFEAGPALARYDQVRLLPPCLPTKIVGVGRNYHHPGEEQGERQTSDPVFFLKPPSAVIGPADAIVLPTGCLEVYFEAELAVVIGRRARHVAPETAGEYILGYTCGNDVTARMAGGMRVQGAGAKSYDTFCPLGPSLVTSLDASDLSIRSRKNGQHRQESSTRAMILPPHQLISHISRIMTLLPGDVILTGTPPSPDVLRPGDLVEVEIEGIGTLANRAEAEDAVHQLGEPGQVADQSRTSS